MAKNIFIHWYFKIDYPPAATTHFKKRVLARLQDCLAKIKKDVIIDISFIDQKEIKAINKRFRRVPRATNVLSFPLHQTVQAINRAQSPTHLGDILICPEFPTRLAPSTIIYLILHAAKHLIGKHHK